MNPVWKRELRARWRGWRAFALVFVTVVILAGIFIWQYHENTRYFGAQEYSDPRQRLSLLGQNLFAILAWLQVVLWMLISPVLTATAISTEREKGLLEGLQLSRLSAGQIVGGKLLSSLSLIALLIVVTLPITATCFMMGGVSPREFFLVLMLHAATATCCAAIGLAVSAWCRNSMTSLALSISAVFVWSVSAFVAVMIAFNGLRGGPPAWPWRSLLELFAKMHPITATTEIGSTAIPWTTSTPSWAASLVFLLAVTLCCFVIATIGTRRIVSTPFRFEWKMLQKQLHAVDASNLEAPPIKPKSESKYKRWELGALARMQFSNPVLGREVRACFRPRSTSIAMLVLAGVLLPLAAYAYAQGFYWVLFNAQMREVIGPSVLGIYLVMVILLSAVLGAGALAREHEGQTWESLRLSLLSAREVLWGKMGAPLLVCAVCGIVFLPIVLPCVRSLGSSRLRSGGMSVTELLACLAIIFSSAWCFTLLGLLFSQYTRRSVTAICWTLGVLFTMLIAVPVYVDSLGSRSMENLLTKWHPVLMMVDVFDRKVRYDNNHDVILVSSALTAALPCTVLLLFIGGACFLLLWRELNMSRKTEGR